MSSFFSFVSDVDSPTLPLTGGTIQPQSDAAKVVYVTNVGSQQVLRIDTKVGGTNKQTGVVLLGNQAAPPAGTLPSPETVSYYSVAVLDTTDLSEDTGGNVGVAALRVVKSAAHTANYGDVVYGISLQAQTLTASTGNLVKLKAIDATVNHQGSGTITNASVVYDAQWNNVGSSIVPLIVGYNIDPPQNLGTGSITDARGIRVGSVGEDISGGQSARVGTTNAIGIEADYPWVANGVGSQNSAMALWVPDANVGAGNTTGTTTFACAVYLGQPTYATTAGTRTITRPTTLYISGAPVAGSGVTFANGATAIYVASGESYFGGHLGVGAYNTGVQLTTSETLTIGGATADGLAAAYALLPGYTATSAETVTRHNYFYVADVALTNVTVTDSCLFDFPAAPGTHHALDVGTTKTTPGAVDAWEKRNVNGRVGYVPIYYSKTS